ncbi:hypothetical protein [Amorphus sp. 3PC139-8]|uniref:hypothetical protein n=1 Tax=Amorphus sp. 3PC139-8 TaxID=2735676 RepID=UPI00345DDABD
MAPAGIDQKDQESRNRHGKKVGNTEQFRDMLQAKGELFHRSLIFRTSGKPISSLRFVAEAKKTATA